MADPIATLMMDARLSTDARVVGYYIASKGEGEHEIPTDELDDLLSADPNPRRLRQALQQLARRGYVERRPGGRGHPDRFLFRCDEMTALKDRVHTVTDLNTFRPTTAADLKPRSSSKEEGGAVNPPVVPPSLSKSAEAALDQHDDLLSGCRGALTDYLEQHVDPARQSAYVQSLATYLNGHGFRWSGSDGSTIPKEQRTGLIAAALNELGAQNEAGMKNPVGDIRNLRTKLGILTRDYGRTDERRNGRAGGGDAGRPPRQGGGEAQGAGHRSGFVIEE